MKKKQSILIGSLILAIVILGIGGFIYTQKIHNPTVQETKDEVTGVWRADAVTKDGYKWFVEYTFKNGTYTMKTESAFKDNGTYEIVKRFEDNVSIQMRKKSIPFNKEYDIYLSIADNDNTLIIDGMKLYRQK